MASIRARKRSNGTIGCAVLYTHLGQQLSVTFEAEPEAIKFRDAVNTIGAERTMKSWDLPPTVRAQENRPWHDRDPVGAAWVRYRRPNCPVTMCRRGYGCSTNPVGAPGFLSSAVALLRT